MIYNKSQILDSVVNQKRMIILGSKGMLGQMVSKYFLSVGFDVANFDQRFNEFNHSEYVAELNSLPDAFVVNCVGKIKQKSVNPSELLLANAVLPLELSRKLKSTHVLIHPSTDCVFDGLKDGFYDVNSQHNATDVYGWSKSLGESAVSAMPNGMIIRVSIIGTDNNSNKGLLSWFLSNSVNAKIDGYTNHFWNGITTLEWSKRLHEIISSTSRLSEAFILKVVQFGTIHKYSKYNMLKLFQEVFHTNFIIQPTAIERLNRCLRPTILSNELQSQLEELKEFNEK